MEQKEQCIKARLVAKMDDGQYVKYVFEDVHYTSPRYRFITMTRCPNWKGSPPTELQEGFVTFKSVDAGEDTYYCNMDQTFKQYNYTAIYYIEFVPVTHVLKDGYVTSKNSLKVS